MFIDRARIRVAGGAGGNGCCSFRREKFVPRGGPDGGDGGNGGDVCIVADSRLASLLDLRFHPHWKGKQGGHGEGGNRHGRNGAEVVIRVPPGTLVRRAETNEALCDLMEDGQRFLAAQGGRGGKGNARFATSTNRSPKFAEVGEPGEEAQYLLELKVIAEVGLVGLPNAGKSTFLAAVTAATPKIAEYPFTTLSPNLGVARLSDYRTLTIADIPGLIEGAAEGKGLGHDFLRHIERTKVLLFIIDAGDEDPRVTRDILEKELAQYSPGLADRPRVYALNKADIASNRARFQEVAPALGEPFLISAATGEGVPGLLERLWGLVDRVRHTDAGTDAATSQEEYRYEPPYGIERTSRGYRIDGKGVRRAVQMTDFDNDEAVQYFQNKLKRMGVFQALQRLGAQEGQSIMIGDFEFEYHPERH